MSWWEKRQKTWPDLILHNNYFQLDSVLIYSYRKYIIRFSQVIANITVAYFFRLPMIRWQLISQSKSLQWRHMKVMVFQITGTSTVCSTAYPALTIQKHQSFASQALCEGNLLVASGFPTWNVRNCEGNLLVTSGSPHKVSENISISWQQHVPAFIDNFFFITD